VSRIRRKKRRLKHAPVPENDATEAVENPFRLPALSRGLEESAKPKAWRYLEQAMVMEEWLREGEGDLPFEELPLEHRYMLLYWPHAFEFYRLHLFEYLERVLGLSPWNMVARSVLFRLRESDPTGYLALVVAAFGSSVVTSLLAALLLWRVSASAAPVTKAE
jgi:hypothetical protein